ncbi:MAG: hypothetical protein AWU54_266 [Candidatus Frackibacter sp. T328-2]|nr:MAG: hypothetical protein AWU54_266 [Candidatus Frackibacter sp. T328-2]
MKDIYVILAFHAHELLWELPNTLLSYLDEENPMKDSLTTENYLKERQEEGRDIYTLCSKFGDNLDAPLCVEYTNELLIQIKKVMPETFEQLKKDYKRGRIYPLYGHAHHAHVSLLNQDEIKQEIAWNRQYLHNSMKVPYPKYNGLFPPEDSLDHDKLGAIEKANIDYLIFPHLEEGKVPYEIEKEGDYTYKPFFIAAPNQNILAFPRNFPVSQEIWRPITKMKRDEVKSQGYMLGDFPVFDNEYIDGDKEEFPISMEQGVAMYKKVLRQELENAPNNGVLTYIQDLELMDFGDIALKIMEKAWKEILSEDKEKYKIQFVTPDQYINKVLDKEAIDKLAKIKFDKICWAPEIRLILRTDGHYPPLGVNGTGKYTRKKTGIYEHPHIFWENGKYYCGIFDQLINLFGITNTIPLNIEKLGQKDYDLAQESLESQVILYSRIMKRACNWGWRPTEGRQKRPCLLGYLLASTLLKRLEETPDALTLNRELQRIDNHNLVGLSETLEVFINGRLNYLRYGLDELSEKEDKDLSPAYALFKDVEDWKKEALSKAKKLYTINQSKMTPKNLKEILKLLQDYSQAVYLATDFIQKIWGESSDPEFIVAKMYHYLYDLYPPIFPQMIDTIATMNEKDIEEYFAKL